jgi:hypothetical protein
VLDILVNYPEVIKANHHTNHDIGQRRTKETRLKVSYRNIKKQNQKNKQAPMPPRKLDTREQPNQMRSKRTKNNHLTGEQSHTEPRQTVQQNNSLTKHQ